MLSKYLFLSCSCHIFISVLVSKPTSNMTDLLDFYKSALGAKVEYYDETAEPGTKIAFINAGFKSLKDKMQLRFIERPSAARKYTGTEEDISNLYIDLISNNLTIGGLEKIKFLGHDQVHDNKGNNTANCICGFDKWYDNHYGIDGGEVSLTQYKKNFDERGWAYYHAWGGGQGPENVYAVDPTGDSIQLDSSWGGGGAPPGVAGDALGDMCSQGNCKSGYRPTPASCSTAIAKACPGLAQKKSQCADCVYDRAVWATLKAASCMNADAAGYCAPAASDDDEA